MLWSKLKLPGLVIGLVGLAIVAGAWCVPGGAADQPPPGTPARSEPEIGSNDKESTRYRVEVRLMEILAHPDAFHADREVLRFPAMIMSVDEPMNVSIADVGHKVLHSSSLLPEEAKVTVSLQTRVTALRSGKIAVDLTLREKPASGSALAARVRQAASEVSLGTIAKLPLKTRNGEGRQWFDVLLRNHDPNEPILPPAKANVYEIRFQVIEVRRGADKVLAGPTFRVPEGQRAEFVPGEGSTISGKGQNAAVVGRIAPSLALSAKVNKLHDGRLRLDIRAERNEMKSVGGENIEYLAHTIRLVKLIHSDEKVNLPLDGVAKDASAPRVQVRVTPVKQ